MNKEFTKRDGATAFLRRLQIQKDLYNNFITKINDKFVVNTKAVDDFLSGDRSDEKKPEVVIVKLSNDDKKITEKVAKSQGDTVSTVSRELILAGKTNKEVWVIIKAKFKLEDNKKHYPAWYRSEMKRSGKLK